MTELLMSGFDRSYLPPRSLRKITGELEDALSVRVASGKVTAWELLTVDGHHPASQWAKSTLDSILAAGRSDVLGCTDCEDTGFYGLVASGNDDLLVGLLRRVGDGEYESLQADGIWQSYTEDGGAAEVLTLEIAEDLADALTAGASGLMRKYCWPLAFLPPAAVIAAAPLAETAIETGHYAVVDDDDPGAVMMLIRVDEDAMQSFGAGGWEPWESPESDLMAIPLDADALEVCIRQIAGELTASGFGKPGKCKYCDSPATKDIRHSEGMAFIPVCDEHLDKGKEAAAACVPFGDPDPSNIDGIVDKPLAASLLKPDRPLTVSPNPHAEKLRRYWSSGKGAAKIRWGTPSDWRRCYRHLRKYMGLRAKPYCQNLHKRNTGMWTGDRRNRGLLSTGSIDAQIAAAIASGQWTGETERNSDMAETIIAAGVYCEVDESDSGLLRTLVAGGFPVAPPDSWYENPQFTGPTPMEIDDDGRVRGHIATFDVTHIGMAGAVHAPKNRSGYAYFLTGSIKTATGKSVNVGPLTLAGGHAPLHADAGSAVKHYDDTNSGVADVTVGEDAYGIWAAGSLRPSVTPEQIRVFRASPLSGDWRPINGNLELVAACAVNVPGFPIARAQVASGGAVLALVAAGARPLAVRRASMTADAALLERMDALEQRLPLAAEIGEVQVFLGDKEITPEPVVTPEAAMPAVEAVTAEPEPAIPAPVEQVVEPVAASTAVAEAPAAEESSAEAVAAAEQETPGEVQEESADKLDPEQVKQVREDAAALRRDFLREEIHGVQAAGKVPPAFLNNAGKNKSIPETERKGGGYPIKDAASLKDAIQAVGRAKPGDRAKTIAHIKAAAAKLGLTKMLPSTPGW